MFQNSVSVWSNPGPSLTKLELNSTLFSEIHSKIQYELTKIPISLKKLLL